jgi:AraC-like DNA-binding protein
VDASGNVWAGSLNEGLYFLDRTDGCMIQKNPAEGMRSRFVTNLVHLTGNVMLMTTSSEVLTFSYDDENGIAVNNYFTDPELDFSTNAHLVKEDSLLLGTTDGLLYFSLDDCCHQHCRNSSIAITDFIVNGKSYREQEDMELDINYMDEIKVRRGDNVEIKFTMLDDCSSHSSVYSYSYGDVSGVTVAGSISFEVSQSRTVVQIGHDLSGESRKIVVSATYDSLVIYILIVAVAVSILLLILLWLSVRRSRRQKPDVIEFEINSIKFASKDQDFVQKAMQIVNNHISDSEFKQEDFIREMGVSRTLLTDRLKELTGFTPVSLILEVRLKTAYTSIMESDGKIRVSEVAYSVGFNDAKYFSTCFRKKFGVTPKELISQRNNADMTKEEV